MNKKTDEQGFTLIELLLGVVIIGILLAVIVPRAWRANVDAKYGLVRQNCTELVAFAHEWAEQMIQAQGDDSTSIINAYFNSLTRGYSNQTNGNRSTAPNAQWIGRVSSNWNSRTHPGDNRIGGRTPSDLPEASVEDIVPQEMLPRNPFSGRNVFRDAPPSQGQGGPLVTVPGMIAAGRASEDASHTYTYYALVFQGTDSEPPTDRTGYPNASPTTEQFHAGMGLNLAGLRNGVFMARLANGQP